MFFLSRNTEILLCVLLLAEFECRMFELHNFKIKQDYCFTAGIVGFCDKAFVAMKKAVLWGNLLKTSAFVQA